MNVASAYCGLKYIGTERANKGDFTFYAKQKKGTKAGGVFRKVYASTYITFSK